MLRTLEVSRMKLRISDVSRILDIPVETIRFYERNNVINPVRDDINNYRYYDAWDILTIMDFISFRNMGFSVKEATDAVHLRDITNIMSTVNEKITELRQRLAYDQMLLDYLIAFHRELAVAPYNYGIFWYEALPEIHYIAFSSEAGEEYPDITSHDSKITTWLKATPFTQGVKHITLNSDYTIQDSELWTLSLESRYARYFHLHEGEGVFTIPAHMCLTTYINAGNRGEFSTDLLEPILTYAKKNELAVIDDVLCSVLVKGRKDGVYFRCIKVSLPVKPVFGLP